MFFALLMMGVQSSKEPRAELQNGYWIPKLLGWVGIAVGSFFIPNEFFIGWGTFVNMPGAFLFILIQVVLLIDFAYTVSENLLGIVVY
jgi:hypothetical protein